MKPFRIPLFILGSALMALAAQAAPQSGVELHTAATQEKTTVAADGSKHTEMVPAARVLPGTEVTYTITYHNTDKKPADSVVVNDPVPAHMDYVDGSAQGANTVIEYSVDGGKTWAGSLDKLSVKNADGTTRTAMAKDCTNLRWTVKGSVAGGASGTVSFRAVLQ